MPESLLAVLKFIFLGLLYLFFFRVIRAVWTELREPKAVQMVAVPQGRRAAAPRVDRRAPGGRAGSERLVVRAPPDMLGQAFDLGDELTVGRASGCGVSLPDDTFVSQLHARVFRRDGALYVEDLGSTNGTFVNQRPVSSPDGAAQGRSAADRQDRARAVPMTTLRAGSATDIGNVRTTNQDQLLVESPLFAVADGMGGHAAGEVAALTAVEALRSAFDKDPTGDGLLAAAEAANRSIWDRAQADSELRGMGTTLVAVALVDEDGEDRLAIVNVGDSRVYLLRGGELEQLTTDHSLVQELVDDGQLSEVEATVHPQRHVLTRALGVDSDVGVDEIQLLPMRGDRLLLCSDGLSRELNDSQVASVLRRFADPGQAARELVAEAKAKGGSDNITVVIIDVVDDDDLALTSSAALAAAPGPIIATTPQYETTGGKGLAGADAGGRGGWGRDATHRRPRRPGSASSPCGSWASSPFCCCSSGGRSWRSGGTPGAATSSASITPS